MEPEEPQPDPSRKRRKGPAEEEMAPDVKLSRKENTERIWSRLAGDSAPNFGPGPAQSAVPEDCHLPYHYLRQFITNQFLDAISHKPMLYCIRKGGSQDKVNLINRDSILISAGIIYLTGYITTAQRELWWENRQVSRHDYVKKLMSRDSFRDIIRYTYFVEPEDFSADDPFWKIRPLFQEINRTAKELVFQSERISVDESMVHYFGPHSLKQRIVEKPDRYGWKLWIMTTAAGELLCCQPYAGAKTKIIGP